MHILPLVSADHWIGYWYQHLKELNGLWASSLGEAVRIQLGCWLLRQALQLELPTCPSVPVYRPPLPLCSGLQGVCGEAEEEGSWGPGLVGQPDPLSGKHPPCPPLPRIAGLLRGWWLPSKEGEGQSCHWETLLSVKSLFIKIVLGKELLRPAAWVSHTWPEFY